MKLTVHRRQDATPSGVAFWPASVVRSGDARRREQEVRNGCEAFLAVLTHLRDYDDAHEYVYEMPESVDEA